MFIIIIHIDYIFLLIFVILGHHNLYIYTFFKMLIRLKIIFNKIKLIKIKNFVLIEKPILFKPKKIQDIYIYNFQFILIVFLNFFSFLFL